MATLIDVDGNVNGYATLTLTGIQVGDHIYVLTNTAVTGVVGSVQGALTNVKTGSGGILWAKVATTIAATETFAVTYSPPQNAFEGGYVIRGLPASLPSSSAISGPGSMGSLGFGGGTQHMNGNQNPGGASDWTALLEVVTLQRSTGTAAMNAPAGPAWYDLYNPAAGSPAYGMAVSGWLEGESPEPRDYTGPMGNGWDYSATATGAGSTAFMGGIYAQFLHAAFPSPPTADLSVVPTTGDEDLHVEADVSGSTDAEDSDHILYTIDWGDGSDPTASAYVDEVPTRSHVYHSPGDYTVTLTVTDSDDNETQDTVDVTVDPVYIAFPPPFEPISRKVDIRQLPHEVNSRMFDDL